MPNYFLRSAFLILLLWCGALWVSGQAKNAIGLRSALNVSGNGGGFGAVLQGEIKVRYYLSRA